jgi:hypothetical protein
MKHASTGALSALLMFAGLRNLCLAPLSGSWGGCVSERVWRMDQDRIGRARVRAKVSGGPIGERGETVGGGQRAAQQGQKKKLAEDGSCFGGGQAGGWRVTIPEIRGTN